MFNDKLSNEEKKKFKIFFTSRLSNEQIQKFLILFYNCDDDVKVQHLYSTLYSIKGFKEYKEAENKKNVIISIEDIYFNHRFDIKWCKFLYSIYKEEYKEFFLSEVEKYYNYIFNS